MKKLKTNGCSVIICCYNSSDRLPATLACLGEQYLPDGFTMEIIVVNNNSTDQTAEVATKEWEAFKRYNASLRIVDEKTPGQMFARIRGAKEACFETLIFCDDDNHLSSDYVWTAFNLLNNNKKIGAAGGQNLPVAEEGIFPEWFDEYCDKYGMGIPSNESGDISKRGFVLGAGLITRKFLFISVFDPAYPSLLNGRHGEKLSTGDDFEYTKRLLLWDYSLYYDQRLILHHFVPKERLTTGYRDRLMQGIMEAGKILYKYDVAIRVYRKNKSKNRWRLILLAPFRIFLSETGLSRRVAEDERMTLFYLWPWLPSKKTPEAIIKKFIQRK